MTRNELPLWRRWRRRLYWWALQAVVRLAEGSDLSRGRQLGVQLARLGLRLRRPERETAAANLARAFPELAPAARERLLRRATDALGANLFDALAVDHLLADPLRGVRNGGPGDGAGDPLAELPELAGAGRGVVILTGHMGCWELLGAWLAREVPARGLGPLAVVTGTVHNAPVNRFLQDRRRRFGLKVLPREAGAAPLVRHLRDGGIVAVLLDQNTRADSLDVPFFGRPAPTPAGLAKVVLKFGIPVLPMAIARRGEGHAVVALPSLWPEARNDETDAAPALTGFLAEWNRRLEELIRRNPAEWVWFHRRWSEFGGSDTDGTGVES